MNYFCCNFKAVYLVQFCYLVLSCSVLVQAKAMQDPEIQNILSDPVMRQVGIEAQYLHEYNFETPFYYLL